jgi:hypothetical protein
MAFVSKCRNLVRWWPLTAFVMGVGLTPSASAQEHGSEASGHEEHFHRNELALVLASTYEAGEEKNLFTVGGEYERRFTSRLGAGATFEHLSEVGGWVFIFPITFRVYRELKLLAGPGFEHQSRRPEEHGDVPGEVGGEAENLFLFRIGVHYGFELGERYSIVPGIELDWIDEEHGVARALVYGVNLGVAF